LDLKFITIPNEEAKSQWVASIKRLDELEKVMINELKGKRKVLKELEDRANVVPDSALKGLSLEFDLICMGKRSILIHPDSSTVIVVNNWQNVKLIELPWNGIALGWNDIEIASLRYYNPLLVSTGLVNPVTTKDFVNIVTCENPYNYFLELSLDFSMVTTNLVSGPILDQVMKCHAETGKCTKVKVLVINRGLSPDLIKFTNDQKELLELSIYDHRGGPNDLELSWFKNTFNSPILTSLNLRGYRIQQIDINLFANLPSLTNLNLSRNEIETITNIECIPKLNTLDLGENSIMGTLKLDHTCLESLRLSCNNKLKVLKLNMPSIKRLYIIDCSSIISLDKDFFEGIPTLEEISLGSLPNVSISREISSLKAIYAGGDNLRDRIARFNQKALRPRYIDTFQVIKSPLIS